MKMPVVDKGDHLTQLYCVLEANQYFLPVARTHWRWLLNVLYYRFSTRDGFAPHVAMAGDIFGCHNWECYWHLVGCCQKSYYLHFTGQPMVTVRPYRCIVPSVGKPAL